MIRRERKLFITYGRRKLLMTMNFLKINKTYYRLFAFWDKTDKQEAVVISTHGIEKTDHIRKEYF